MTDHIEFSKLVSAAGKFHAATQYDKELECLRFMYEAEPKEAYPYIQRFRAERTAAARSGHLPKENMSLVGKAYLLTARDYFDDYCIYLEWNRPARNRFYLPRRASLLVVVKQLQRLADDELDILCVSMPPGVGKSELAIFFLTWLSGRDPKHAMLGGSHNNAFLRGVYDECLRIMDGEEYTWKEIFVARVEATNAADMKIDVGKPQRFSTLQFSSIGSGNAGKVRAIQLLYCDDLIEGIEEAMSPDRLEKKWRLYTTDLKQRKQGNCKELHIATRWSVKDVIGRLEELHEGDPRAEFICVPALDENGNSNFDYGGENGFTTEFYGEIRESMDDASWEALYMNRPIEREGRLYLEAELRRFYDLPSRDPDCVVAVCDTANGSGDDNVVLVMNVYGDDHYLVDCICEPISGSAFEDRCARLLIQRGVQECQFESNNAGGRIADLVDEIAYHMASDLGKRRPHITKKHTQANKETKIYINAPWVKEHVLFLDETKIIKGSMYDRMMKALVRYSLKGKNKHDDVPDALAQYALYSDNINTVTFRVRKRIF